MRPLRLRLNAMRRHLLGGTIRSRLTIIYGGLFIASGAVLLVITGLLWGRATNGRLAIAAAVPRKILAIVGPSGGIAVSVPPPNFVQVRSAQVPKQLQLVGAQLRLVAAGQQSSDLHQLLFYSGIALGIMALLAVMFGWLIAGRVLRPLRTITSTAKEISASNLHERLHMRGPDDELKKLGDTFDELLGRLEHSFEAQRLFVANASHELRTPLATMRASIDVALGKPDPIPPPMVRLTNGLQQELDHVDQLLEGFLALARAQRGPAEGEASVGLDVLVTSALERRSSAAHRLGLDVEVNKCAEAVVTGNEILLRQMVENVIDNGVHHNVPGGYLRVRTTVDRATVRLRVENGGTLFEEEEVHALGQPFRRLGTARTGSDNGFGLGLSIVSAIADAHGGRLELHALMSGGIQVIVELPLTSRAPVGAST